MQTDLCYTESQHGKWNQILQVQLLILYHFQLHPDGWVFFSLSQSSPLQSPLHLNTIATITTARAPPTAPNTAALLCPVILSDSSAFLNNVETDSEAITTMKNVSSNITCKVGHVNNLTLYRQDIKSLWHRIIILYYWEEGMQQWQVISCIKCAVLVGDNFKIIVTNSQIRVTWKPYIIFFWPFTLGSLMFYSQLLCDWYEGDCIGYV